MKRYWPLIFLPALIGVGFRIAAALGWYDDYILSIRADTSTLAMLGGIIITAVLAVLLVVFKWRDKQHQDQLARHETNRAAERRQFLQRLDHELKNPLTAIQAALVNVSGAENTDTIESIRTQAKRIGRLVADLRKLAELETRPIERAPVDLEGVLRESVAIVQKMPDSERRSLHLSLPQAPWPLPRVLGDEDLLMLAVHNLLDNAIKFTPLGATVEVRAFEDNDIVTVEVADTGSGMAVDEIPHVWQELYRGSGARAVPGSGLGLPLVRAIVERHGGQVGIRSRVDQGTVFSMRLPAIDVPEL